MHDHHYPKPLFVAEFGVPTSWGDAHIAFFSGMDHGGHDEETQGRYAARMFHNLAQAGCGGGALFGWIDEWWKTCWITTELDFPADRRYRWHNVTSPEQNFGLIAFDEDPPPFAPVPLTGSPGPVQGVSWAATHRFFELEIATDPAQRPLVIGLDTHRTNWSGIECGETVLPDGTAHPGAQRTGVGARRPGPGSTLRDAGL